MTPEEIWAKRRERARRWAHSDMRGYPVVPLEEETEETLAAEPKPEQLKKSKTAKE
jgi:hypothetical protein